MQYCNLLAGGRGSLHRASSLSFDKGSLHLSEGRVFIDCRSFSSDWHCLGCTLHVVEERKGIIRGSLFDFSALVLPQNPQAVRLKEEISRTSKRLKAAEKELGERKKKYSEQKEKITKYQKDIERVTQGRVSSQRLPADPVGVSGCS